MQWHYWASLNDFIGAETSERKYSQAFCCAGIFDANVWWFQKHGLNFIGHDA
jgi:hypothetical protein